MKLTILGCGSSVGVPSVSCNCIICSSVDVRNKRLRTSALIEKKDIKLLIDSGPDLREQALKNNISQLDGVFYTHGHADHINGVDELRSFRSKNTDVNSIPVFGDETTLCKIKDRSPYMFVPQEMNAVCAKSFLTSNIISYYETEYILGISVILFPQEHGSVTSSGIIFDERIAYCTDFKRIPERAFFFLNKIEVLVVECLGYTETYSHAHFDLTLQLIDRISPKIAVMTHMGHEVDFSTISEQIEQLKTSTQIIIPYDGYVVEI